MAIAVGHPRGGRGRAGLAHRAVPRGDPHARRRSAGGGQAPRARAGPAHERRARRSPLEPRLRARLACGRRSGAATSATRCPGTARASTGSSCAARRSCAGRCTATCSRRCARAVCRSAPARCSSPACGSPRPGDARVRIGAGTFLNLGVMVAAQELVEIGEHCMLANGCFVSDATHRYDDPEQPITWQGFESKGPTRIGDNCWLRGQRRGHQRRDDRRALRDRRQQRGHGDVEPFSIAAGAPARVIRRIDRASPLARRHAVGRAAQCGDVELAHPEHRLRRALGPLRVGAREQLAPCPSA